MRTWREKDGSVVVDLTMRTYYPRGNMASVKQISKRLEENDFAEGDSFWISLPDGRIELEVIEVDTQHEYGMPLFAIRNAEVKSSSGNMPTYLIHWKSTIYGTSTVVANTSEEARKLAENGEDGDFDHNDDFGGSTWEIDEIEELSPDDIASQSSGIWRPVMNAVNLLHSAQDGS